RGSMSDLALEAAELERIRSEAEAILARHTGRTPDQVRDDTDRALVLRGPQAIEYGVADTVPGPAELPAAHQEALRPGA
ncbi:MAG: ATP-dependent Clp protease proteolytic subunit, partial [Ilumatobacter fluminis]